VAAYAGDTGPRTAIPWPDQGRGSRGRSCRRVGSRPDRHRADRQPVGALGCGGPNVPGLRYFRWC